jgi:hypothetical protein
MLVTCDSGVMFIFQQSKGNEDVVLGKIGLWTYVFTYCVVLL